MKSSIVFGLWALLEMSLLSVAAQSVSKKAYSVFFKGSGENLEILFERNVKNTSKGSATFYTIPSYDMVDVIEGINDSTEKYFLNPKNCLGVIKSDSSNACYYFLQVEKPDFRIVDSKYRGKDGSLIPHTKLDPGLIWVNLSNLAKEHVNYNDGIKGEKVHPVKFYPQYLDEKSNQSLKDIALEDKYETTIDETRKFDDCLTKDGRNKIRVYQGDNSYFRISDLINQKSKVGVVDEIPKDNYVVRKTEIGLDTLFNMNDFNGELFDKQRPLFVSWKNSNDDNWYVNWSDLINEHPGVLRLAYRDENGQIFQTFTRDMFDCEVDQITKGLESKGVSSSSGSSETDPDKPTSSGTAGNGKDKSSNLWPYVIIIAVVLIIVGGAAYFFLKRK